MVEDVLADNIHDDYNVSWELMYSKKLPFKAAEKLAKAWRDEVDFGFVLFAKSDATPEVLDEWADSDEVETISLIAYHPNTRLETLLKLTRNPFP